MMNIRRLSKSFLKPVVIILVIGLIVGLFYVFPWNSLGNQQLLYKGPSARVNGVKISDQDFNKALLRFWQQYGSFLTEEQMKANTLEYLIGQELIKQEIEKRKISVSDREVEDLLGEIKVYNQIDSEEELEMLIYQTGAGDLKGLKKMLREIIAEQKLYGVLGKEANLEVTEEEMVASYEELEVAHILISTSSDVTEEPLSDGEALKKAEEVYQKLQDGANFAELAKEYSDDISNKNQGGNLGRAPIEYFKNAFVPEFVEAALQLEVGQYSAPVKTQFGYHVITVLEKKLAQGEQWEKEKEKIKEDLLANKFLTTKKSEWLQEQRQKHAKIEILDPSLLGYHLAQEEKWAEAAVAYENALKDKRYKNSLNTFLSLAEAYKENKNYEAALGVFERLPKDLKDNYNVDLAKADIYQAKEDKAGLKAALSAAEAKAGEDLTLLNQILRKMKDAELTEESKTLEEKIAALEKKNREEQEELNRRLQEEQKRLQAEQFQEGIIETPAD